MKAFLSAALMLAVIVLSACRKDCTHPQPIIEKNVVISFNGETISFLQVDSAAIIMKKEGSNNPHFRRFDKVSGTLNLVMDDNLTGKWTAELYVYSTEANNNHLFKRNIGFSLPLNADVKLFGPADETNSIWTKIF